MLAVKSPEADEPALYPNFMGHVVKSGINQCAGALSGAMFGEFWLTKVLDERLKDILAFCNLEKEELACNQCRHDDRPHRRMKLGLVSSLRVPPRRTSTVGEFLAFSKNTSCQQTKTRRGPQQVRARTSPLDPPLFADSVIHQPFRHAVCFAAGNRPVLQ